MKKKLARLVILLFAVITCLIIFNFIPIETNSVSNEVTPTTETIEVVIKFNEEEIINTDPMKDIPKLLPIPVIAEQIALGKFGEPENYENNLYFIGYNVAEIEEYINSSYLQYIVPEEGKYIEAKRVWNTMISWGWTPETCAGIIGNIMAEIGGGTLNFDDWNHNGQSGYGMIQWLGGRRSLIKKRYGQYPTIKEQLEFMKDEMFGTNNTPKQIKSSVLSKILNEDGNQSPESIAFAFATYYERCAVQHRSFRRGYARRAYEYFMS